MFFNKSLTKQSSVELFFKSYEIKIHAKNYTEKNYKLAQSPALKM